MALLQDGALFRYNDLEADIKPRTPEGFRLYFAGNTSKNTYFHLTRYGAHRLNSQLLDKHLISRWVESRKNGEALGELMIDSGAHTAFYTGEKLDVEAYIQYLNSIDDHVKVSVQADRVPNHGANGIEDFEIAPKENWENYLYMREKLKSPEKLLPVFHIGESFDWLLNMINWRGENGEKVSYIGIAARQEDPWPHKIRFIEKCFAVIKKSSQPDIKTHALGMTKLIVLEQYPFTSADSTTWVINAAMGMIMTPVGNVVVSKKSTHNPASYYRLPKSAQEIVREYAGKYGMTIEDLTEDYSARAVLNIHFLLDWARNYEYKPSSIKRKKLI